MSAPNVLAAAEALDPQGGLRALDATAAAATAVLAAPDPYRDAVRADPVIAAHIKEAENLGTSDARGLLLPLREAALPAAEAAAQPHAERLRALREALTSGQLARRYGGPEVARKVYDVRAAEVRQEMGAAVREALAPIRARLDLLDRNYAGIVEAANELPAPTAPALDALKTLLSLLPNLTPAIALEELERAVGTAARDKDARGNLRYLLPVTRSLAARPEYADTTDEGFALRVLIKRAEALTRDRRHVAAELLRRYSGRFRWELDVVESVVGTSGAWAGSTAANIREMPRGGGLLKTILVPPEEE